MEISALVSILTVGNELLGDNCVGARVASELKSRLLCFTASRSEFELCFVYTCSYKTTREG